MSWWRWLLISLAVVVAVWVAFVVWLAAVGKRDNSTTAVPAASC